jgi:hypothetical protein
MLQKVANGLGELKKEIVFVGGAVAELYAKTKNSKVQNLEIFFTL